jgi:glutathione S-transferase
MLPVESSHDKVFAKQVEVLCNGMYDALVLLFFERQKGEGEGKRREEKRREEKRREEKRREEKRREAKSGWNGKQGTLGGRGDDGIELVVGEKEFSISGKFGLADAVAGSLLGYLKVRCQALPNVPLQNDADVEWQVRFADHGWQEKYPNLKTY